MIKLLAGAAAVALAASAVSADPGGGKGGGAAKGGGGDHAAHAQPAPGGKGASGGGGAAATKAKGHSAAQQAGAKGAGAGGHGNAKPETRQARASDHGNKPSQAEHGRAKADVVREARSRDEGQPHLGGGRQDRLAGGDRTRFDWHAVIPERSRGLIEGCPPGLAKKNNGCMPPGQLRNASAAGFLSRPDWWDLDDDWYDDVNWNDGRYDYYDGYLVRYGDRGIDSWLPLLGGGLAPGNLWPSQFAPVALPPYYQDYYGLGSPDSYRYYDDTLFRIDPQSQAITAITALLTGDTIGVGQPMPPGYEVYNVPYSYRDRYVDGPDANYRYSDGSIYQIDPTTQLVQAAIQLLT